jgi:hypothetical protein
MRGGGWEGRLNLSCLTRIFLVGIEFGVAAEDQGAAIGRGKMVVEHLDGGELVEHGPRREARRQRLEASAQRDKGTPSSALGVQRHAEMFRQSPAQTC